MPTVPLKEIVDAECVEKVTLILHDSVLPQREQLRSAIARSGRTNIEHCACEQVLGMKLPRLLVAIDTGKRCRVSTGLVPSDGCTRFFDDYTGPETALAVAKHRDTGFTTWLSAGVCKLDSEARALDKCGYAACKNGRDATKCYIASSTGPEFCP